MLNRTPPALLLCLALGCNRADVGERQVERSGTSPSVQAQAATAPAAPPKAITNRFGMTFKFVSVDDKPAGLGDVGKFGLKFPTKSYYLAQDVLSPKQYKQFIAVVEDRDRDKPSHRRRTYYATSEWRDCYNFGIELAALDPDYDYRFPTREEWVFACTNGYDQQCPGTASPNTVTPPKITHPNKYGLANMMDYDVECGDLPGLFFGKVSNSTIDATPFPCDCLYYQFGSPDGDDGLNEIIEPRYVLVPQEKK